MEINGDGHVNEDGTTTHGRSPRFSYWAAFFVFSIVTLGASVEEKNVNSDVDSEARSDQTWSVTCAAITFAVTFIVVGLQLHPIGASLFVGTRIEGFVILVLTAFWAATVSIVSDARNGLAVDDNDGAVTNGNLYYFSWAGFVCSVMLIVSYLRGVFNVDVPGEIRNRSARLTTWSAALAAQLIVMGASANIFDQHCAPMTEFVTSSYCTRTEFGIAVGAIGTISALAVVGMKIATSSCPFIMESICAGVLVTVDAFGVAFLTSAKGPGSALGNLYYFSWISLLCATSLVASCIQTYNGFSPAAPAAGTAVDPKDQEIQVETLDCPPDNL